MLDWLLSLGHNTCHALLAMLILMVHLTAVFGRTKRRCQQNARMICKLALEEGIESNKGVALPDNHRRHCSVGMVVQ